MAHTARLSRALTVQPQPSSSLVTEEADEAAHFAETVPFQLSLIVLPAGSSTGSPSRGRTPEVTHLPRCRTGAAPGAPAGKPGPCSCCCSQSFPLHTRSCASVSAWLLVLPALPHLHLLIKGWQEPREFTRAGSTVISGFPHSKFHRALFGPTTSSGYSNLR